MNYLDVCLMGLAVVFIKGVSWGAIDTSWMAGSFRGHALRYIVSSATAYLVYVLFGFRMMYGPMEEVPDYLPIDSNLYTTDLVMQASFAVTVACIFAALAARTARTLVVVLQSALLAGLAYPVLAGLKWSRDISGALPGI